MINIALNTFREIVRNKFLYVILFFAAIFIVFSLLLGRLTIGDDNKVIVDFGLAMIEIFGLVGVLFVGSQLLFKEVEGKTIFLILSKPIRRYEFIIGKFLGFSGTISIIVLLQSLLFLGMLFLKDIEITSLIVWSLFFTLLKLEILLSIVFLLSTFMSNMLIILVSLMIYFLSHGFSLILDMAYKTESTVVVQFSRGLQLLFPPFESLNTKDVIGSFDDFPLYFFLTNTAHAIVYLGLILFITIYIFERKKFEN